MLTTTSINRFHRPLLPMLAFTGLCCARTSIADDDYGREAPIEELFKSELIFPQSRGELQLGTTPTYRDGGEGTAFLLPVGIEYGITDSLQFEAEWESYIDADAAMQEESGSGQGNLGLGLLYSWIDIAGSGFHLGAGFEYAFASGDRKFLEEDNREDSQELYLIFAKDLEADSGSQLFIQAGVELQKDGRRSLPIGHFDAEEEDEDESGSHDPNVWFANIGGYAKWKEVVLSLEWNLSEDEEERYATPGISFQPADGVEIGLGFAVGLTQEADDYQVIGKLVWEFGD